MSEKQYSKQDIAALAGELTGVYMQALEQLEEKGGSFPELVFASIVALKGIGLMMVDDEQQVVKDLREIAETALGANVVGKRFQDEEEMKAWLAEQGRDLEGVLDKPSGPVH